jgi:Holliday junction resolvasome RuvABC DNA-binding subunit
VSAAEPVVTGSKVRDEVLLALTSLGMTHNAAEAVLDRMDWDPDDKASVEDVVRRALKYAGGA